MNAALLSGAFALTGVALGGLATHFLSLRREREARNHSLSVEHRNMLRSKYEELYSLIAKWSIAMSTNALPFTAAMQGRITYDQANDLFIKNTEGRDFHFDRIELLIDAYVVQCRESFDRCLEFRSRMNAIHADFRRQYDAQGPSGEYNQAGPYIDATRAFAAAVENLKKQVVGCLHELP